jgi:hypothetical protein
MKCSINQTAFQLEALKNFHLYSIPTHIVIKESIDV